MASWKERSITTQEGVRYNIHFAPDWNTSYFTSRWHEKAETRILYVLEDIKDRNSKMGYRITGHEIWVYNDNEDDAKFHTPKTIDMTQEVFDVLRNGRPEPTEWTTGRPQTVEVWST